MARDGNNGEAYGASWYPNTMNPKTGERSHARNSYYDPVSGRSNFHIMLKTIANELVFDSGKKLTARGVKVTNSLTGATQTVYAKKEVILAAGAVNTVKLLQLSGIGPKSVLQAAGIKVKLEHDGVGANFQDHPYTFLGFNISNMSTPNPTTLATNPAFNASAWTQYATERTGPLTQARGNALAFIPLPEVAPKTYRDLVSQVKNLKNDAYLPPIYKKSAKLLKGVREQRKVLAGLFQSKEAGIVEFPIPAAGSGVLVGLEKPLSRGVIGINPTNPQGPPKILYNALTNPIDKSVMGACVRYIRTVWARPELKKFSPVETSPGAQYTTDQDLISKMVELGSIWPTLAHPSGSCAMMPEVRIPLCENPLDAWLTLISHRPLVGAFPMSSYSMEWIDYLLLMHRSCLLSLLSIFRLPCMLLVRRLVISLAIGIRSRRMLVVPFFCQADTISYKKCNSAA